MQNRLTMQKCIIISVLFLCSAFYIQAQHLNAIGKVTLGIGFNRLSQDFNGINTFYSPGGGLGFEAGLEGELPQDLFWYGMLGICLNINLHFENTNGLKNRTFYTWNRKMISAGANKFFDIKNKYIDNVFAGGGFTFYIPGKLKREETNDYLGAIDYKSTIGFQLEGGCTFHLNESIILRPALRYRYATFKSSDYSQGDLDELESGLKTARIGGIDLSVSIIKQIRGGRRR